MLKIKIKGIIRLIRRMAFQQRLSRNIQYIPKKLEKMPDGNWKHL